MKKIYNIKNYLMLAGLLVLGFASCKKENNGGVDGTVGGKGAPTITSVRTVNKTVTDTVISARTTYDATGKATTVNDTNRTHTTIKALDSTTVTGKLGNYYAVMGTNLGSTTKIALNGVSVLFNRALSSDNTVVFNIPQSVPTSQPQPNTLVITTLYGSVTYTFTVLPPSPTVTSVSDYNFSANAQLTLKGTGFNPVTAIKLRNTNDVVSIVSKNDSVLVVKMPVTTVARANLLFTYTSGSNTGAQAASTQEFVSIDNAYQIFANNDFRNLWADASWSGPSGTTTGVSKQGTASAKASYPAGGWQIEGWANWYPSITYDPAYKFLTFWVKGGVADHTLVLVGDKMAGGYGQVQNANAYAAQLIKVPANVWTYFKIPLGPPSTTNVNVLNFWKNGNVAAQLGFFLQGMDGDVNETMYFDEVMFIK